LPASPLSPEFTRRSGTEEPPDKGLVANSQLPLVKSGHNQTGKSLTVPTRSVHISTMCGQQGDSTH
jgi:hypothetical protein